MSILSGSPDQEAERRSITSASPVGSPSVGLPTLQPGGLTGWCRRLAERRLHLCLGPRPGRYWRLPPGRNRPDYVAALKEADRSFLAGNLNLGPLHHVISNLLDEQVKSGNGDEVLDTEPPASSADGALTQIRGGLLLLARQLCTELWARGQRLEKQLLAQRDSAQMGGLCLRQQVPVFVLVFRFSGSESDANHRFGPLRLWCGSAPTRRSEPASPENRLWRDFSGSGAAFAATFPQLGMRIRTEGSKVCLPASY